MIYYQIPPEGDGKRVHDFRELTAGELYTAKELTKYHIKMSKCIRREIPKSKIYWMFGARKPFEEYR